jgi:dUTP pyrophosphatase
MNTIQLKQLRPTAAVSTKGSYDAACWDIYAAEPAWLSAGTTVLVPTGWAMKIPRGFCVKIYARSGLATKHGIRLANGVGIVDADYRGEVMVALANDTNASYQIAAGDRIAQFMLERVEPTALMVVSELDDTARGAGGFGSTG